MRGDTAVAVVGEQVSDSTWNVGIAYSTDAGRTWQYGGFIDQPQNYHVSSVLLVDEGAVIVGYAGLKGDRNRAYISVAPAPDFQLQSIDLPAEFTGNVMLIKIVEINGGWLIVGSTLVDSGDGYYLARATTWFSDDEGDTWSKHVLKIPYTDETMAWDFAVGPDGSWNIFGDVYYTGVSNWDAAWIRSSDDGDSWSLASPQAMRQAGDQSAYCGTFADNGDVMILGYTYAKRGDVSQVWLGHDGESASPLGDPMLPVEGGTPSGDFLTTCFAYDGDFVVAGSPQEGKGVQFYMVDSGVLTPGGTLEENGQKAWADQVVFADNVVLIFGQIRGVGYDSDVAIWRGQEG